MNKIIVLIDLENIILNIPVYEIGEGSLSVAFEKFKHWLEQTGEITGFFVFIPEDRSLHNLEFLFQEQKCWIIRCPKIPLEEILKQGFFAEGEDIDTVDSSIRNFGDMMLKINSDITHVCICSGDADFVLFAKRIQKNNKKVMIMVGSIDSLSERLYQCVDKNDNNLPLLHIFSPVK